MSYIYIGVSWNRGTPSHHPFLDWISPYKPTIFRYPYLWKPPYIQFYLYIQWVAVSTHPKTICQRTHVCVYEEDELSALKVQEMADQSGSRCGKRFEMLLPENGVYDKLCNIIKITLCNIVRNYGILRGSQLLVTWSLVLSSSQRRKLQEKK